MVQLERRIEIEAQSDQVWRFFNDPHRVAQCMPGTELLNSLGKNEYSGLLRVKFGPKTVNFTGQAAFQPGVDQRSGSVVARGSDRRGSSKAEMHLDFRLTDDNDGSNLETGEDASTKGTVTTVTIHMTVRLGGPLSQFTETGGARVLESMIDDFATCVTRLLEHPLEEVADEQQAISGFRRLRGSKK